MRLAILAAAALLAAGTAPAHASDAPSAQIEIGDLNLASSAGIARFEGRVRGAMRQLCGVVTGVGITEIRRVQLCRASVFAEAHSQLRLAALSGQGRHAR